MTLTIPISTICVNTMMEIYQVSKSEKIAEYTSSCPDLPIKFHCPVSDAREALAALFAMVTILAERDGEYKIFFTDHLAKMAYNYKYEGHWRTVQEILELSTMMPYQITEVLLRKMSPEDYFGNFVPLVKRVTKRIRFVKVYQNNRNRVKRTQRKRGYDDKGTLRLSHQWLPSDVHLGCNPSREDRRSKSYTPRNSAYWTSKSIRRDPT